MESFLVLASRLLAGLQLIQIPSTDVQAALVVIHALPEVANLGLASTALLGRVVGLVLLCEVGVLGLLLGRCGGAAAEPASDGVADGGTYCDTTKSCC